MTVSAASVPTGFRALPLSITQLSLAAVLKCGQSFRWSIFPLYFPGTEPATESTCPTHEYRLCLRDRVVCLRQSSDTLFYRSMFPGPPLQETEEHAKEAETLEWIRDYFQLDVDLVKLYDQWSKRDPVFRSFEKRFGGIRMLRQDPFENLISFICSSNNNISRITKMVKSLCKHYSPPLITIPAPISIPVSASGSDLPEDITCESYHPFPPPSALANPEVSATLRSLGFGYRADFIQKTAKMLIDTHGSTKLNQTNLEPAEEWLFTLRQLSTTDAREELLKFVGVGRKVADCILLMSLDKNEVIPVDTHVHQIATKYYGLKAISKTKSNMTPQLYSQVNDKLAAVWGEYAGWAHSVLFTSDLKVFSSYGLQTPTESPSPSLSASPSTSSVVPQTSSPSPKKRRRAEATLQSIPEVRMAKKDTAILDDSQALEGLGLADRVKKCRRGKVSTIPDTTLPVT